MADTSGTLSNTDAEIVELKAGFTITKKDGEYSMGDILLSEEQVKLLDETGSIYPAPNTVASGDSIMVGTIAGSYVLDGIIRRDAKARIIRDDVVIYDGNINSIAREKDQVKEVKQGLECGITIENYNDIKEGDVIEAYEIVEVKRWK